MAVSAVIKTKTDATHVFSGSELVEGLVIVELDKDVDIEEIVIKLKVEESTTVNYWHVNKERKQRRTAHSDRILYSREWRLFPTADLAQASSKSFKIHRGNHKYEFTAQFPNKLLPPSIVGNEGQYSVKYFLKCTVRRASAWKANCRVEKQLTFSPPSPLAAISDPNFAVVKAQGVLNIKHLKSGIFSRAQKTPVGITAFLRFPTAGLAQAPYPMRLGSQIRSDVAVTLRRVSISVRSITRWRAYDTFQQEFGEENAEVHSLVTINVNKKGKKFDLDDELFNTICGLYLPPTFDSKLITRTYTLLLTAELADPGFPDNIINLEASTSILVLSPQLQDPHAQDSRAEDSNYLAASTQSPVGSSTVSRQSSVRYDGPPSGSPEPHESRRESRASQSVPFGNHQRALSNASERAHRSAEAADFRTPPGQPNEVSTPWYPEGKDNAPLKSFNWTDFELEPPQAPMSSWSDRTRPLQAPPHSHYDTVAYPEIPEEPFLEQPRLSFPEIPPIETEAEPPIYVPEASPYQSPIEPSEQAHLSPGRQQPIEPVPSPVYEAVATPHETMQNPYSEPAGMSQWNQSPHNSLSRQDMGAAAGASYENGGYPQVSVAPPSLSSLSANGPVHEPINESVSGPFADPSSGAPASYRYKVGGSRPPIPGSPYK